MRSLFFLFILISCRLIAREKSDTSCPVNHQEIRKCLSQGIKYLERTQRKITVPGHSYSGEWQTFMGLQRGFFLLGRQNKFEDSNCFSTASVHNALATVYLLYPEYKTIPPMLGLAFDRVMGYRNKDKFNFWNLLPPNRDLKKGDDTTNRPLVRRPTTYKLRTRYINNAANVVEDADDTALGYAAIALRNQLFEKTGQKDTSHFHTGKVSLIFEQYRDIKRKNLHWYNYLNGNDRETGAYLTWLGQEYRFNRWYLYKVLGHNATFFLPSSECFPHAYVPYIPYGTNDLDGVVNANILTCLSLYGELDAEGVVSAIQYIEKKSKRKRYDRVGIYYPNRYQFPYAVSQAYSSGVNKLKKSMDYLLEYLLESQNKDGSWSSKRRLNKKDKLQSTAYALNALINLGDIEQNKTEIPIEKAIRYIINQAVYDENGIHWKGGVFFSGGTVVRNALLWKSDAYTTAVILQALAKYRHYLEEKH